MYTQGSRWAWMCVVLGCFVVGFVCVCSGFFVCVGVVCVEVCVCCCCFEVCGVSF